MGLFDGTLLERPVLCNRCELDIKLCQCPPPDTAPQQQILKIRVEKRKGGKLVTVVSGFDCSSAQRQRTLATLQSKCAAGGCVADTNIELQGDHTHRLPALLIASGYRVK